MPKKTKNGKKNGKNGGITPRKSKFIDFYIQTSNGRQSAIKAGYSEKGAEVAASRLLTNVNIIAEIERRKEVLAKNAGITAQDVINELAKIAFLKSSDVFKYGTTEVELADNVKVKRGVAILKPHEELSLAADASIASIKETNQGLEIKLYDKQKALDSLGKYFGINNEEEIKKAVAIKESEKKDMPDPVEGMTREEKVKAIEKLIS